MMSIEKHEKAIELIEGIKHFRSKIARRKEAIDGMFGAMKQYKKGCLHDIDICEMSIKRLQSRYNRLIFPDGKQNLYTAARDLVNALNENEIHHKIDGELNDIEKQLELWD